MSRTSAGRQSAPGRRNLPSLLGANPAWDAVSKMASLKALCLLILSPPTPQQRAWSPKTLLLQRQEGQGPSRSKMGSPRRYLAARTNSVGRRSSPRAFKGAQFSQSPEWGREREPRRAFSLTSFSPTSSCRRWSWCWSTLAEIILCVRPARSAAWTSSPLDAERAASS